MTSTMLISLVAPVLVVAIAVWALVGAIYGVVAGLFFLTRVYDDPPEAPIRRFRWEIVLLGGGQNYKGVLRMRMFWVSLAACPSGLRVSVPRHLTPFRRSFLVPWREIEVDRTLEVLSTVKLTLGHPMVGAVWIYPHVADAFAKAVGPRWPERADASGPGD